MQHALEHISVKGDGRGGTFSEFSVSTTTIGANDKRSSCRRRPQRQQQRTKALVLHKPYLSPKSSPPTLFNTTSLLSLAHFHISRLGITILGNHPNRTADMLRWRQWTRTSFVPGALTASALESPCTYSALASLSARLEDLLKGGNSARALTCYSRSLAELRRARPSADAVAAAQLLAVFEMLTGEVDSDTWTKHTTGAVAMLMSSRSAVSQEVCRPILVEALLDSGQGAYARAPCQALAKRALPACAQKDSLDGRLPALVQETAELVDRWHYEARTGILDFGCCFALLASAHTLRSSLRDLALIARTNEGTWLDGQGFDYLGLGLTCLVALDRMILALRPAGLRPIEDVEEDTYGICWQLLRTEMRCNEYEPRWTWR